MCQKLKGELTCTTMLDIFTLSNIVLHCQRPSLVTIVHDLVWLQHTLKYKLSVANLMQTLQLS